MIRRNVWLHHEQSKRPSISSEESISDYEQVRVYFPHVFSDLFSNQSFMSKLDPLHLYRLKFNLIGSAGDFGSCLG